jgi:hypothetical protein
VARASGSWHFGQASIAANSLSSTIPENYRPGPASPTILHRSPLNSPTAARAWRLLGNTTRGAVPFWR